MSNSFGDRLRNVRKARGLSQDEMGALIGTSKQVISRYETGQRTPKITVVNQYASKLGISLNELMGDESISEELKVSLRSDSPGDEEMLALLQELKDRPELKTLFSSSYKASKEDVLRAAKFLDAMSADNDDF